MTEALVRSSDACRSAAPLRHAQTVTFDAPLALELGGELEGVTVAYETYGRRTANGDNAILVCHALSGDSHVARHDDGDDAGWWDLVVGPGKPIDTDRYFVVCSNVLGGCRGTTGPGCTDPATGRPYGAAFPTITVGDMVEVQRRLVDHLRIASLRAVVGGSLGGHQAMTWAVRHPDRVRGCIALATSPRLTSQALAFDVVGRNAILSDPGYHGGTYYDVDGGPAVGLAIARMLAHITYLSREAMTAKFDAGRLLLPPNTPTAFEKRFSVGAYLAHQGHKFVERFDANSYVTLTMAMDLFDLGATPDELRQTLARSRCRWLVLSFSSDWLFPPAQSRQIVEALLDADRPVSFCDVEASGGHDSFLLEESLPTFGELIRAFAARVDDTGPVGPLARTAKEGRAGKATNIFDGHRLDHDAILQLIPVGTSVLDLGCGDGFLLSRLRERGHARVVGVELEERSLLACVVRGLDVVQHDLEQGLAPFADGHFDVVVLSHTLQSVVDTEGIIDEMLRVGKSCIVSFPNFAYHKLRTMLHEEGRSPKAGGIYQFEWYDTPNRRFPSITDVDEFCARKSIRVHRRVYLDSETGCHVLEEPNRDADMAIFVLSR